MVTCTFENGDKALLRHVTVNSLAFKDGKILLVKRAAHMLEGEKWGLPGGYLDRDENLSQGALRELLEETGYSGKVKQLFTIIDRPDRPKEDRQNVSFIFITDVGEKVGEPDEEQTEMRWFELGKVPPLIEMAFDHGEMIQKYIQEKDHGVFPIITL